MNSRNPWRWGPIVLCCLLLWGCEARVRESVPGPWVEIPPGSRLVLIEPVAIPQGRARAFLGRGRAGTSQDASCALEVRRIEHEGIQTVAAGAITITRVQDYTALVSRQDPRPALDSGPRFQLASHGDSGGSQMVRFGYHFWLDTHHDPNLMRLTCLGRLDDPASTRPPTLAEIQSALGDQARLELGGRAPAP